MVTAGAKRGKTCAHTFASDWLILGGEASKNEGADPTIQTIFDVVCQMTTRNFQI